MLISPYILAALAFAAMLIMFVRRQYEHGITRLFIFLFYVWITIVDAPLEETRLLSRWFWALLLGTEIMSYVLVRIIQRKQRGNN